MKAFVRKLSLAMTCIGLGATSVDAQVLLHRGTSREIEQGRLVRHVVDTPLADLPRLWQVLDQFPLVEASANSLRIQSLVCILQGEGLIEEISSTLAPRRLSA